MILLSIAVEKEGPEVSNPSRLLSLIVMIGTKGRCAKTLLALLAFLGLAAGMAASVAPAEAADPALRCALDKRKAALKKMSAINACFRERPQLGNPIPNPTCLDDASETFRKAFQRIEARGGCLPETGDADVVEDFIDESGLRLVLLLQGACQPAGAVCGGGNPLCCTGLVCTGVIGHPPSCN